MREKLLFWGRNYGYHATLECFHILLHFLQESPKSDLGELVGVVVSDDHHENDSTLEKMAQTANVPILFAHQNRVNEPPFIRQLKYLDPSLMITVQFPAIYKEPLISIPTKACLNIHLGWPLRGGFVDVRAVYENLPEYFAILHYINKGIDTGNIIGKESFVLSTKETGYTVAEKASQTAVQLFKNHFLPLIGEIVPEGEKQDISKTKYSNKLLPEDGRVNWTKTSKDIDRLIRACYHPRQKGAFSILEGKQIYFKPGQILWQNHGLNPGSVALDGEFLRIATNDGFYLVKEIHMGDKEYHQASNFPLTNNQGQFES